MVFEGGQKFFTEKNICRGLGVRHVVVFTEALPFVAME
jgi:hypothetical protein